MIDNLRRIIAIGVVGLTCAGLILPVMASAGQYEDFLVEKD